MIDDDERNVKRDAGRHELVSCDEKQLLVLEL
jgi:hypothetical protein